MSFLFGWLFAVSVVEKPDEPYAVLSLLPGFAIYIPILFITFALGLGRIVTGISTLKTTENIKPISNTKTFLVVLPFLLLFIFSLFLIASIGA